jgi:hypothetical protein
MATPIDTSNYDKLNSDIQSVLSSGQVPLMSVYTDAAATILETDSHGPIQNRPIMNVSYTQSYIGEDGNPTNPFVTIAFYDGTSFTEIFKSVDFVDDHWYIITTAPVNYTRFGNPQ